MTDIQCVKGQLDDKLQQIINAGFERHSREHDSPSFQKERINWLVYEDSRQLVGVLTADVMWDWLYIDELWVEEHWRSQGIGQTLMAKAEAYALSQNMTGLWLWTQSWQAPEFYRKLGYKQFTRFDDFPKGHSRIGFRKQFSLSAE